MRLISFSVCLSVFSLVINFGFGQATNKQYYNLKIESKHVTEYATLFPMVNLDVFEHTDGLPQGTIKSVLQSVDGYLWISVLNYGLLRYDGYHFRPFVFAKDDSSSLPTSNIISIVPSVNNGLWLVTDKGLIWFNLKTYQSKIIREIPEQVFETTEGWGCVEDKLGKLWVFGHGLYLYDPLSYRIEKMSDSLAFDVLNNQRINITKYFFQNNYGRSELSSDGSIWLAATAPLNLIRIDPMSKKITSYPWLLNYSYATVGVLPDPDSTHIWTSFSGRIGRFNFKDYSWLLIDLKINNLTEIPDQYFISHIEDDKLWLIKGNTITILDTKNFKAQLYKNEQKTPGSLKMAPGLYGSRWIWSSRNKFFCNITVSKRFTYAKILPHDEQIFSYWKDKKSNIEWFGAIAGDGVASLYRYDVTNRNTSRFKIPVDNAIYIIIHRLNSTELLVDAWPVEIGSATHTLFRFNTVSMSFEPGFYKSASRNASSHFSYSFREIISDKENSLWLSSSGGKLFKYDSLKDSLYLWNNNDSDPKLYRIVSSSDSNFIWAGGNHLYKVYTHEHKVEKVYTPEDKLEKFQGFEKPSYVIPLIEDLKGNVLMKLKEGVAFFNPSTKNISPLPGISSLYSPIIDTSNNVIARTENGLLFYNTKTKTKRLYNERDGLINWQTLRNTDKDEILIDDCYRFPTSFFYAESPEPPLHFLSIKASGKELNGTNNVDSLSFIELNHDENYIGIEFAYLNFLPNRYTKYACILEGIDTSWQQLGAKNFINYFNLTPGSYTFRVKAANTEGVWGKERILHIEIVPAFWQTTWFKMIVILVSIFFIAAILYWIYRNRVHQLGLKFQLEQEKVRQQQIELEFEKRLADLTLSALRSQINPHFIFNCLNSIKLYATQNDMGAATDYLTKFSSLIRQVLDNSMNERITLSSELEVLRLYIEMEAMRFKDKLRYNITVEKNVDADYVEIPPLLLQPYVENAIWHGLMPKEKGGELDIFVAMKDEHTLSVRIKDDGIGRAKAADHKSITTQHKSFGMKVTLERMKLINRKYKTPISITIDDLKGGDGEPSGTLVTIQIQIE